MLLLLYELDVCLMTVFMFQEHHGMNSLTKNLNKTIEESIKEDGVWIFSDTECKVDKKVCYTWTSLFQAFQDKEFVVLIQNGANTKLKKFTRISSN